MVGAISSPSRLSLPYSSASHSSNLDTDLMTLKTRKWFTSFKRFWQRMERLRYKRLESKLLQTVLDNCNDVLGYEKMFLRFHSSYLRETSGPRDISVDSFLPFLGMFKSLKHLWDNILIHFAIILHFHTHNDLNLKHIRRSMTSLFKTWSKYSLFSRNVFLTLEGQMEGK